jgi:hypothetical protein
MDYTTINVPQPYYVTDQRNPGVATMDPNSMQQFLASRQQTEQAGRENPCAATNPEGSVQSGHNPFQPTPTVPVPVLEIPPQDNYYHDPARQIDIRLIAANHPVQFSSPMPQASHDPLSEISSPQATHEVQGQFQRPEVHPAGPWYSAMQYHPPVATTIEQLSLYDFGWIKEDNDDPTMQMPNQRIDP